MSARTRRALTLIELMVAVGFLAVGAVALLTCVNAMVTHGAYASRRAAVLAACENSIDSVRGGAYADSVTVGTSISILKVTGLESSVTITRTISLQAGYTDLYLVDVKATWNEVPSSGHVRADALELATYVRPYDT